MHKRINNSLKEVHLSHISKTIPNLFPFAAAALIVLTCPLPSMWKVQ